MRLSKEYIDKAHSLGLYVDRSDGTIYPAIPREDFLNAVECLKISETERLNYCQADICYCDFSPTFNCHPILLRSYSTYVAVYIPATDRLFVFDYYSATTCSHVAKFKAWLKNHYYRVLQFPIYRRVRDKNGSHLEYEPFIPFVTKEDYYK